ncbi:MAG TPA: hypothetical protein VK691_05940 [Solirubrobacteraceae bacterium]|nr:hypothetical protein [Solirubrobacteraceae bacterium]
MARQPADQLLGGGRGDQQLTILERYPFSLQGAQASASSRARSWSEVELCVAGMAVVGGTLG